MSPILWGLLAFVAWTAGAVFVGLLVGPVLKRRDEQREPWTSGLDLVLDDQPIEVLAPAEQVKRLERTWLL